MTIPDLLALCDEAIREHAVPVESTGHAIALAASCRTREPVLARALREGLTTNAEVVKYLRAESDELTDFVKLIWPGPKLVMSPREARSLAASLMRAAAEAELQPDRAGRSEP